MILLKRPPDRNKLMELKSKDLQDYLNKNNVSTYGLVGNNKITITDKTRNYRSFLYVFLEKHELVDLFCNVHILINRKGVWGN